MVGISVCTSLNAGVSLQVAHGPPRARLGGDEPSLRAALRRHRSCRVRAGPRPRQGSDWSLADRPASRSPPSTTVTGRSTGHQSAPCRRLLPSGPGAGRLSLRQHLRALPVFRTDAANITVLGVQKLDAVALAEDAERRGWVEGPSVTVASSPASTYCWPKGTPGDLSRRRSPASSARLRRAADRPWTVQLRCCCH